MTDRTAASGEQAEPVAADRPAAGGVAGYAATAAGVAGYAATAAGVAAYGAAIVAFGYALVSLYWAVGGRALLSTVGGYAEQLAGQGGALPVLVALLVVLAKIAGAMLALALVRSWGQAVPRRWLLIGAAAVSVLLVVYGGVNVVAGALVLAKILHSSGSVNWTALRWHVGLWDLWFLVWGILLALATVGYRRQAMPAVPR